MRLWASDNDEAWNLNMTNIVTQRKRIKSYSFEETCFEIFGDVRNFSKIREYTNNFGLLDRFHFWDIFLLMLSLVGYYLLTSFSNKLKSINPAITGPRGKHQLLSFWIMMPTLIEFLLNCGLLVSTNLPYVYKQAWCDSCVEGSNVMTLIAMYASYKMAIIAEMADLVSATEIAEIPPKGWNYRMVIIAEISGWTGWNGWIGWIDKVGWNGGID